MPNDPSGNEVFSLTYTDYDAVGHKERESLPFVGSVPTDPNQWVRYEYDGQGRVVGVTDALGTTSFEYGALTKTVTDALGRTKTLESDARGNLVMVTERNGTEEHETAYAL